MVREVGLDNNDRIEISRLWLSVFLLGALLLMILCWFGCKGAYDIVINQIPITNKNQILWFFTPVVFAASFYAFIITTDCLLTKPYVVILSPAGIDLTWPKAQFIAWNEIHDIRIDITTSYRVTFEHLVIEKNTDKTGWFQRLFTPNEIKIFIPLLKGGGDAAYEKVVAAQHRYAIKNR